MKVSILLFFFHYNNDRDREHGSKYKDVFKCSKRTTGELSFFEWWVVGGGRLKWGGEECLRFEKRVEAVSHPLGNGQTSPGSIWQTMLGGY